MGPVETYLAEMRELRSARAGVKEVTYYTALANLLDGVGRTLKPRVRCILQLQNRGAGNPDGGLFTADQFPKGGDEPAGAGIPSRGVIEIKSTSEDAWITADGEQVSKYWGRYNQVLVTNYRDFVLVGRDPEGRQVKLETFHLAPSEAEFWSDAGMPGKTAGRIGESFVEFLKRAMLLAAPLDSASDLAWFLASYAHEAKFRIELGAFPALATFRTALEEALGMTFEGSKGGHFFRSTLVQTLFYGMFSAWVLWSKSNPSRTARFQWRLSDQHLRVPILRKLFREVADPGGMESMDLNEVLDWAAATLNRVDRPAFFQNFEERHAVQYFYEPFLEAFDPELRKDLGVWYTPIEIVDYMVERVDRVLREELNLPDGLADSNVYVLDPCCGTGAYLVSVLNRIAVTLREKGGDALLSQDLKQAAMERVFGFEILPAPFVVAHLQLGLLMQHLGAPFSEKGKRERAGVYLTNSLTGWDPPVKPKPLPYMEMEEERDAADGVKRAKPILVILGNPPYNSFAEVARVEEERGLSDAYRVAKKAPAPQGQGLNDLYVRFFRMAERRIVEKTGAGVVCFISNYSWLDGLSFTAMRERYLEVFDRIWIDNLNGDKYKTGKLTPEGKPDPSIFSTEFNREGIQVGTAVALLVRKRESQGADAVRFRQMWGKEKRAELLAGKEHDGKALYRSVTPELALGLPFTPALVEANYLSWPLLPELFPASFPGVKTSRDDVVVDIDKDRLIRRMEQYFDPEISHEKMRQISPGAMASTARFQAEDARDKLRRRRFKPPEISHEEICRISPGVMASTARLQSEETPDESLRRGFIGENVVRYCYRPFDTRWLYWEPDTKLLDEKRSEYCPHLSSENIWIEARQKQPMEHFDRGYVTSQLSDNFGNGLSNFFPLYLSGAALPGAATREANLSSHAEAYLSQHGHAAADLFYHTVAVLHSPFYRRENSGALRQDWPRIPLPAGAVAIQASAVLGRQVAALLDTEQAVPGVTVSPVGPELRVLAILTATSGTLDPDQGHLDLTAKWGHAGKAGVTMPGKGKTVERPYTPAELAAFAESGIDVTLLGDTTYDVYLNGAAFWTNIPSAVWEYTLGGYQVIKKWMSYREKELLGRGLTKKEARHVPDIARRIAALLLMGPALDVNYDAVKCESYGWNPVARASLNAD
jgi:hypothetical protein